MEHVEIIRTERMIISSYKGLPVTQVLIDEDEFRVDDLEWWLTALRAHFSIPVDMVIEKKGVYSIGIHAQMAMYPGLFEVNRIAYIVTNPRQRRMAEIARSTYLQAHPITFVESLESAYQYFQEHGEEQN